MSTSNKLIIAAFIIMMAALLVHNNQLKAVYLGKTYLDPYKDYIVLEHKDFNAIDIRSAGLANVKIVQGPYRVLVRRTNKMKVNISQNGGRLEISASYKEKNRYSGNYYGGFEVFVSCPSLVSLNMDSKYMEDGKEITDSVATDDYWESKSEIYGFKLDSLAINTDHGSYLKLDSNEIGMLSANIGVSGGSQSILEIKKQNKITSATLAIKNSSQLHLSSSITNLSYHFDDSAGVFMTGAVSKQFR